MEEKRKKEKNKNLSAIIKNKNLSMFKRRHGTSVNVQIRICNKKKKKKLRNGEWSETVKKKLSWLEREWEPILMEVTRRPQALRTTPMLLAVTPLPRPLTTPPEMRTYFIGWGMNEWVVGEVFVFISEREGWYFGGRNRIAPRWNETAQLKTLSSSTSAI